MTAANRIALAPMCHKALGERWVEAERREPT